MSRLRTTITLLVLLAILAAGALYGWRGLTGTTDDEESADESSEVCTTPERVVRAAGTRVSVYNAGAPGGTAADVMDALTSRNFQQGELANAYDVDIDGIVLWVANSDGGPARLVHQQFDEASIVERGNRLGPGVNVLVATSFDGLASDAPRRITIELPERCEPAN